MIVSAADHPSVFPTPLHKSPSPARPKGQSGPPEHPHPGTRVEEHHMMAFCHLLQHGYRLLHEAVHQSHMQQLSRSLRQQRHRRPHNSRHRAPATPPSPLPGTHQPQAQQDHAECPSTVRSKPPNRRPARCRTDPLAKRPLHNSPSPHPEISQLRGITLSCGTAATILPPHIRSANSNSLRSIFFLRFRASVRGTPSMTKTGAKPSASQ